MSRPLTIQYGDETLTLTASETMVAVPDTPSLERATSFGRNDENREEVVRLGRFRIVSCSQADNTTDETIERMNRARSDSFARPNATKVYHTSDDEIPFVPSGEIYLEFGEKVGDKAATEILIRHDLEYVKEVGQYGIVVRLISGDAVEMCAKLQRLDSIEVAEPELLTFGELRSSRLPDDELLRKQWHLRNTGRIDGSGIGLREGADARVVEAWQAMGNVGDASIVVAVIDDGFDLGHPDLGPSSRIVAPYDFTRNSTFVGPGLSRPNPGPYYDGDDWHGTACAGVAVGRTDRDGVVGAAPASRWMPIRWGRHLSDSEIENWFGHAKDNGADVISCSWGAKPKYYPLSRRMQIAISDCAKNGRNGKGCVICFAAGNSNRNIYDPPRSVDGFATHPDVIAVAASTSVDTRAHYSNHGDDVSVCAPSSGAGGRGVLTADVRGSYMYNNRNYFQGYSPGDFTVLDSRFVFGGTSSSCPLVAGICALLLSIEPSLTAREVKSILQNTARKIGDLHSYGTTGHSNQFGYGCVDAKTAVQELLPDTPVNRYREDRPRQSRNV